MPAGFAFAVIDEIALLEIAGRAVDADEVAQAAAALLDRRGQLAPFLELAQACETADEEAFARAAGLSRQARTRAQT